jgi:hypothetical protein
MIMKKLVLLLWAFLILLPNANATPIYWTDWTSSTNSSSPLADSVIGTLNGVNVTYSGDFTFVQTGTGINYWTEPLPANKPYTGNSVISNAPTASEMIALNTQTTNTLKFSSPITNPILAIVSMGQPNFSVTYDFSEDYTYIGSGWGYWSAVTGQAGAYTILSSEIFQGRELHGVLLFIGTFSEISWTSTAENWHGFTVGTPVPEPISMLLFGTGLVGVSGYVRKKIKRN